MVLLIINTFLKFNLLSPLTLNLYQDAVTLFAQATFVLASSIHLQAYTRNDHIRLKTL